MKRSLLLTAIALFLYSMLYASGSDSGVLAQYEGYYVSYKAKHDAALKAKLDALAAQAKPLIIEEFMEKSGLKTQFKDIGSMAKGMTPVYLANMGIAPDEKAKQKFDEMADGIFDPEKMIAGIRAYMDKYYSADAMMENILWLDSDTGKKMTGLEIRETSSGNTQALVDFVKAFREEDLTAARKKIFEELSVVTEQDRTEQQLAAGVVKQLSQGLNEAVEENYRVSGAKISEMAKKATENIGSEAEKRTSLAMKAFTYGTASDAELRQYADHLGSRYGKWSISAVNNATVMAVCTAAHEYGKMMGKCAADLRSQVGSEDGWQEYVFKEEKCRVKMPSQPKYQEQTIQTQAGAILLKMRTAETDSAAYTVSTVNDYIQRDADPETADKILMGAAKGSAQKNEIISTKYIETGGFRGIDVVFTGKGIKTYNRIILAGRDFYQLLYICAVNDNTTKNLQIFLDSFSVDRASQKTRPAAGARNGMNP
jgi:hypothetical protein